MTGKRRGRCVFWHLRIICAEIHRTWWKTRNKYKGMKSRYDAVVKDPKRHRFLIQLLPHSFHVTFRACFQQEKCSKYKLHQKAENKTWLFFGARKARLPCPSCSKQPSMTLEDPLNQPECYRMLQDIGFSRSPELFIPQKWKFSGVQDSLSGHDSWQDVIWLIS